MKYILKTSLAIVLLAAQAIAQSTIGTNSTNPFTATPLLDLGTSTYQGFQGGLYPNGSNTIPESHAVAGSQFASLVGPLDSDGQPDPHGKIVFATLGMSNAMFESMTFISKAQANPNVNNTTLAIVNGALSNMTACYWTVANGTPPCPVSVQNQFDRVRDEVLTPAGLSENQVQVVWIKDADMDPALQGCGARGTSSCQSLCNPTVAECINTPQATEALRYEQELGEIIRAAKTRWPNLQLAFLDSRIYAGYAKSTVNPEPYAFEYGFSVKWLVEAQITQMNTGAVDAIAGDLNFNNDTAPWVAWGPYLWADGLIPRSDGLVWCNGQSGDPCNGEQDFQSDGTHPSEQGGDKVANMLISYFSTSPYSKDWFNAMATMSLSAMTLNFGSQMLYTQSGDQSVTVTNSGTGPLTLTSVAASAGFSASSNCTNIQPGGTCAVSVTFMPTTLTTQTGTVTLTGLANNSPQIINLTGTGITGAALTPIGSKFGPVAVGESAIGKSITLANIQTTALTDIQVSIIGSNDYSQTNTCPAALSARQRCTITVTFTPSSPGADNATLVVTDSAANSPQTAALIGTGAAPPMLLPASTTFPNQNVGTTSTAITFALANDSALPLSNLVISTTGDFAVFSTTCGISLSTMSKCTISVVFTPTAGGPRTGTLSVSDSASHSPQVSRLSGTGE
jgi:hypothetical protein